MWALTLANHGMEATMGIGTSIVLIAVGAILRFAVTIHTANVNWYVIGDILMIVGAVGLLISLIWLATASQRATTTVVQRETDTTTEI